MRSADLPLLGNIPNERLQRGLIESLSHPVERRAEVVDKLLAGVCCAHFASQFSGLLDIRITGLNPKEIGVGSELLGALGRSRESCTVVVEAFASTRAVTRPDNGRLGVVVCQSTAAREGEIGVALDIGLVGIPRGLGGSLRFKVGVDSYR
jgi:hypothetical protein